ncbi:hypothetical protein EV148_10872 [Dokdonella fugitiva]|jgi:hypothetical protein|uniref:Uncharacterized protein n=1 Tax=Dokdonella fugitiva TaxID=328517 RepID=A0A4R2I3E4_9GAMM|nr:hypothetical protein [Dokdonella fugitiva]TCO38236.1 hypothetical protein EV148_10872 [Dokdonella fugitiva]
MSEPSIGETHMSGTGVVPCSEVGPCPAVDPCAAAVRVLPVRP